MAIPRAAVYALLSSDSVLSSLGLEEVYAANSADTVPEELFLILHWEDNARAFGSRAVEQLVVWAHDKNRDYERIDKVLSRVRELLEGALHVLGDDGVTLTQADWQGWSRDLFDDGYNTVTKNGAWSVVAR